MSLPNKPRAVVIDLDGTLIDSVPDLAYCVDEMMLRLGRSPWGEAKVRTWVGNGVERLVKRALTNDLSAEPDEYEFTRAMPLFMTLYTENTSQRSRLFEGVLAGLDYLKAASYAIACVTNKAERFTLPLLRDKGILDYFQVVVSGDTTPRKKPDPLPLQHAAQVLGVLPEQCLMVGDSRHDVAAARAAGFSVACVPYGYNHGDDIAEAEPDALIASLAQLADLLGKAG